MPDRHGRMLTTCWRIMAVPKPYGRGAMRRLHWLETQRLEAGGMYRESGLEVDRHRRGDRGRTILEPGIAATVAVALVLLLSGGLHDHERHRGRRLAPVPVRRARRLA